VIVVAKKIKDIKNDVKINNADCTVENRKDCLDVVKNNDKYVEKCGRKNDQSYTKEECKTLKNDIIQLENDCKAYRSCRTEIENEKEKLLESDDCKKCEACRNCQKSIRDSVKKAKNENKDCQNANNNECMKAIKDNDLFKETCGKGKRKSKFNLENKEDCKSIKNSLIEDEDKCVPFKACRNAIEKSKIESLESDDCQACDFKDSTTTTTTTKAI
jgi:hypothetical protein